MNIGAVVLAGGKSSRMEGKNKALLPYSGGTLLEHVIGALSDFPETLLSVDKGERYPDYGLPVIPDQFGACGPIGGLCSALMTCRWDALFAVACDMPHFTGELSSFILSYAVPEYDAVVPVTRAGRVHPLCGIYSKSALPVLQCQIARRDYRMTNALSLMNVKEVPLRHSRYPDSMLRNVNTPRDYGSLGGRKPLIVAVCGLKNAGKTTLISGILPHLCRRGLKVAVIKHDGHDFVPDVPGTDSYRFRECGAWATAVYSESKYMLVKDQKKPSILQIAAHFEEADLILLEGGKYTSFPKIEVFRGDGTLVCAREHLMGVCTDRKMDLGDIPVLSLDQHHQVADFIAARLDREGPVCGTHLEER